MACSADFFYDPFEFTGLAAYLPSNCEGRVSNTAPKGRNTTALGSALGLALLAKQALKGRYWEQNNGYTE